ncbi:hypothetical protein FRC11_014452 [Ceratobasidium sp. 423]|nr:hypothetical protein FRC11_014452 [Ceratobasidium sp. 423]
MSQPTSTLEGPTTLKSLVQDIVILKTHITALKEFIAQEFEKIYATNEEIKSIATAAQDTSEDGAQEQEEDETLKPQKGKAWEEQTPKPRTSLGKGSSLMGWLGWTSSGTLNPPPRRTFNPFARSSSIHFATPLGSRETSPVQEPTKPRTSMEEKEKKYQVEAPSKLKSMVPKDVKKWFMDATVWAKRYKDEFENEQELVLHLFTLLEGEVGDWVFPFQGKLLSEPRTAPI